jgi:hypothetical protein
MNMKDHYSDFFALIMKKLLDWVPYGDPQATSRPCRYCRARVPLPLTLLHLPLRLPLLRYSHCVDFPLGTSD